MLDDVWVFNKGTNDYGVGLVTVLCRWEDYA